MNDRFLSSDENYKRLKSEYFKYSGKIIVAFDFDNTVYDFHNIGDKFPKMVQLLQDCRELGMYLIVFSASEQKRYVEISSYLNENNIPFDAINDNAPFAPFQNREGKIYYNILLDDRAGLREAYNLLSQLIYEVKYKKWSSFQTIIDFK